MLVDGLDEVADSAARDKLVNVLANWASDDNSPYRIVLTTRPIEGSALAPLQRIGAARYELQPFDHEALRQFAVNWFENESLGERFVRQIRAAHLDELVRVPLLATIAAIIFEQHGDRPLPDNQYSLYEVYLKYLRSARSHEPSPLDQACGALLEHLGVVRLETDTSLVAATLEWAARHLPDSPGEDLVTCLAAVGPVTRRGDDLRFLHHSFAEHLAATAKARLLPTEFAPGQPEFARLLHAARPDERGRYARAVLLHFTRLHPAEADVLIRWLRANNAEEHLLAARLLAGHVPASTEVVDAFLTTARAWAKTTQYPALRILQQTSRAAHHPGIAAGLPRSCGKRKALGSPVSKPRRHWRHGCAATSPPRLLPTCDRSSMTSRSPSGTASARRRPCRIVAVKGKPPSGGCERSSPTRPRPHGNAGTRRWCWPTSMAPPVLMRSSR
ncbi:hypothetical protein ALI144C_39190 [Actinosynnema sp. ALI-1.44]|uniref:NACHT domain-containing protein n=1 Tax=Actinosynnema sp. ALI-1.44 TaxID=1933779 RepID=UPI00097C5333|nr:hypothetical protein [Actinosynnema sp. ALI-1.44]ONI74822.1 hypothetical protein ALI144C_39190 [Actinosynnema sp. ALI-1.44]